MHSVQTPYHRATNKGRCPQWPGHLSTVAGGIFGGRYGEFQSNSTPRFEISLTAKESFAPRKNFTILDHRQPLYQRKCADCRARTGHDGTVACPQCGFRDRNKEAAFLSGFSAVWPTPGRPLLHPGKTSFDPLESPVLAPDASDRWRRSHPHNGRRVLCGRPARTATTIRTLRCTCMRPVHQIGPSERVIAGTDSPYSESSSETANQWSRPPPNGGAVYSRLPPSPP